MGLLGMSRGGYRCATAAGLDAALAFAVATRRPQATRSPILRSIRQTSSGSTLGAFPTA